MEFRRLRIQNARDSWCYDIQSGLRSDNRILGNRTGSVIFCHNRNDCEFCECAGLLSLVESIGVIMGPTLEPL